MKKKRFIISMPVPEVIKLVSCSSHPKMIFILLINVKMSKVVGILTFISRLNIMDMV